MVAEMSDGNHSEPDCGSEPELWNASGGCQLEQPDRRAAWRHRSRRSEGAGLLWSRLRGADTQVKEGTLEAVSAISRVRTLVAFSNSRLSLLLFLARHILTGSPSLVHRDGLILPHFWRQIPPQIWRFLLHSDLSQSHPLHNPIPLTLK